MQSLGESSKQDTTVLAAEELDKNLANAYFVLSSSSAAAVNGVNGERKKKKKSGLAEQGP